MENIAVSVVVAVYNRENLLGRCVDSLVRQTLENIEILLVDDYSTDGSWDLMLKLQECYPDKIRIMKSESKGVAYAKNTGIKAAKGTYVTFVDSDDYIDYRMLDRLYTCAMNNSFPEMVYSPIMKVFGTRMQRSAGLAKHDTVEDYLNGSVFYLVGKLFRADLFVRFGLIPIMSIGEDSCFVFSVISRISSIVYVTNAEYYYEQSENSITKDVVSRSIIDDLIKGSDYILEHTNPDYLRYGIRFAFFRICCHIKERAAYEDVFNQWIREHFSYLEQIEDLDTFSPEIYRKYQELKAWEEEIPHNIYLDGFTYECDEAAIVNASKVFREDAEIVILSEKNCDMLACPQIVRDAYQARNMEFVGKYFALKACYDEGGIFIDNSVEVDNPFTPMSCDPCFFGYESETCFSDRVFGAYPKSLCIKRILQTYETEDLYDESFATLSQRIKTVLIGMYNVKLMSCKIEYLTKGISLYPVETFVCQPTKMTEYFVSHYKECFSEEEKRWVLPEGVLESLMVRNTRMETSKLNVERLQRDRDFLNKKAERLGKEVATLKSQLATAKKQLQEKTPERVDNHKDLVFLKDKSARLEQECDFFKKKSTKLEKDVLFLKDKSLRMEQESVFYQNRTTGLEKDILFLKNKSAHLEKDNESYKSKNLELEKIKIDLGNKSIDMEKDILFLKEKSARLEKESEYYRNKTEGYEKDLLFLKDKSARLERDSDEYKNKSEEYKKRTEEFEKNTEFLKERTAQLEDVANSLNDEVMLLEKKLKEFERSRIARMGRGMKNIFSRKDRD